MLVKFFSAFLFFAFLFFLAFFANAQSQEDISLSSCFDNYNFGSINLDKIAPDKKVYQQGETIHFQGLVENHNDYPIVQGSIFGRLIHLGSSPDPLKNSDTVIDEFFVKDDINILANGAYPLEFDYKLPLFAPKGQYQFATYFVVAKKFNLTGLSFVSNIPGGISQFELKDGPLLNYFIDRNSIKVNNQDYSFRDFTPVFSSGGSTSIAFKIKNTSNADAKGKITYKLYKWDSLLQENLFKTDEKDIIVPSQKSQDIAESFKDLPENAYLLKIISNFNQQTTIADIRFVIEGEKGRINFMAFKEFPLQKNNSSDYFVCFHSSASQVNTFNGSINVSIYDRNNLKLAENNYQGIIYPEVLGFSGTFAPPANYDFLRINAQILNDNRDILDTVDIKYDCSIGFDIPNKIDFFQKSPDSISVYGLNWCNQKIPIILQSAIIKSKETSGIVFAENNISSQKLENINLVDGEYQGVFQLGNFILDKDFTIKNIVTQSPKQSEIKDGLVIFLKVGFFIFISFILFCLIVVFYIFKKIKKHHKLT